MQLHHAYDKKLSSEKSLKNASSSNSSLQCISNSKTINFSSNEAKKEMNAALKCATWKKCNFSSPFFWCGIWRTSDSKRMKKFLVHQTFVAVSGYVKRESRLAYKSILCEMRFPCTHIYALQFPRKKTSEMSAFI